MPRAESARRQIRKERPGDLEAIRLVNERAFAQPQEAALVDALRAHCERLLSLVAEEDGALTGHILFSPARIESESGSVEGMALGPMAVLPERQRQGIGSQLVRAGIERLRQEACPFVIVLGHPDYYPRFDFVPASRYAVRCEWDIPDEVFMILPLDPGRLAGVSGLARYRPEFAAEL